MAVIVDVPAALPVTVPLTTVATEVFPEVHVVTVAVSVTPEAEPLTYFSFVAVAVEVPPTEIDVGSRVRLFMRQVITSGTGAAVKVTLTEADKEPAPQSYSA